MGSNLERYKKDLDTLIAKGKKLQLSMEYECYKEHFDKSAKDDEQLKKSLEQLPRLKESYQTWYSEAKALVRQLLPDRLSDFVQHYEKPKQRKKVDYETYRIEDYLQGLNVTRGWEKEKIVGPDAAIPHMQQQLAIIEATKARFESSLFDILQLVQADLFDSELDAARELAKHKFTRAAGALAGVVLERHLKQVSNNHDVKISQKAPGISDLNNALKEASVIDIPQWRFVQHLADVRNLCDHSKDAEPTIEQVGDLVAGVAKIIKTVF
jgi:hypothetical protein